jgi:anti-sigma regulatory factor (Ser/Thr protein kinase)
MRSTATWERSVGCRLRRDPAQVGHARRLVREALADWGLDGYIDHMVLIGSELVTNALRHGAGTISIRLSRGGGALRVEVHDHGAGRPVRQHARADDEGGRGLEEPPGTRSGRNQAGCCHMPTCPPVDAPGRQGCPHA